MDINKLTIPFEIKAVSQKEEDGQQFGYFEGYASTFGTLDSYDDIVVKGAFTDGLGKRKVKMLWQHGGYDVIGSYPEIYEDDRGLYCKGRINLGVEKGREAYALLKAGDVDSMSIGYSTKLSEYDSEKDIRYLKEIDLWEISLVTFPANDMATITDVKSIDTITSLKDAEKLLKEHGFSRNAATALVAKVKSFLRDADTLNADDDQREAVDLEAKLDSFLTHQNDLLISQKLESISQTLKGNKNDSRY